MPETWLEAIAECREAIAYADEVADGLLSDPSFDANLDPFGDDLGPDVYDDESWRDEPETEW